VGTTHGDEGKAAGSSAVARRGDRIEIAFAAVHESAFGTKRT
jgi:hypothetical protein